MVGAGKSGRAATGIGVNAALGVLAGAITGVVATLASVPLRRLAGVSDRALLNGYNLTIAALLLWTAGGVLYALLARFTQNSAAGEPNRGASSPGHRGQGASSPSIGGRGASSPSIGGRGASSPSIGGRGAARAAQGLVVATLVAAVAGIAIILGPLNDFSTRFASCAVPLCLIVTLGGAAVFLALRYLPVPLPAATPVAFVAAVVVAFVVANTDKAAKIKFTFTKLPENVSVHATQTPAATDATPSTTVDSATPPGTAATGATVPAAPATPATTTGSSPTPTTAAAAPTQPGVLHFKVTTGSEAAFTVNEKLTRLPAPSDAIGKTTTITGDVYLTSTALATDPPSTISVDLRTLTSDAPPRDRNIKQNTLETDKFPFATFTITSIDGFPASYREGDEVKVNVTGTMKVHDTEKTVTWTGTARYAAKQLEAIIATDVTMHDFNMKPPSAPVVQSVSDKVHLDLHFVAVQQSS